MAKRMQDKRHKYLVSCWQLSALKHTPLKTHLGGGPQHKTGQHPKPAPLPLPWGCCNDAAAVTNTSCLGPPAGYTMPSHPPFPACPFSLDLDRSPGAAAHAKGPTFLPTLTEPLSHIMDMPKGATASPSSAWHRCPGRAASAAKGDSAWRIQQAWVPSRCHSVKARWSVLTGTEARARLQKASKTALTPAPPACRRSDYASIVMTSRRDGDDCHSAYAALALRLGARWP